MVHGYGFVVTGSLLRVHGYGFMVTGLWLRVHGYEFMVTELEVGAIWCVPVINEVICYT